MKFSDNYDRRDFGSRALKGLFALLTLPAVGYLNQGCGDEPDDDKDEKPMVDPTDPGIINNKNMREGAVITSWWNNDYSGYNYAQTLEKMVEAGVESVSLISTYYMSTPTTPGIYSKIQKTPLDSAIRDGIAKAKLKGLHTVLKPHVDPESGYRTDIKFSNESDWSAWFADYREFITHYAALAQETGVDMLIIGTELKGTTHRPEWNSIIDEVRSIYKGEVVYGANWDNYQNVPFWEKLDYIGIDAYFPLTGKMNPSPQEIEQAWLNKAGEIEAFAQQKGKRVMFTEIGYQDFDGTNTNPSWAPTSNPDEDEQSDCYSGTFNALFNKPWVAGMYWWDIHHDRVDNDGFSFLNKKAELVVNDFYHRADNTGGVQK